MNLDITLHPLNELGISSGVGLVGGRILYMTEEQSEIDKFIEKIDMEKKFYSSLGLRNQAEYLISKMKLKNYVRDAGTDSVFMSKIISTKNNLDMKNFRASDEFNNKAVVELFVDYYIHLAAFYEKKTLLKDDVLKDIGDGSKFNGYAKNYFLNNDQNDPVACIFINHIFNGKAWLYNCAVKKEYRGLGLFKLLLTYVENELVKMNVEEIGLFCAEKDFVKKVYDACGFRDVALLKSCRLSKLQTNS